MGKSLEESIVDFMSRNGMVNLVEIHAEVNPNPPRPEAHTMYAVRKVVYRMVAEGCITSPFRGQYTMVTATNNRED